MHIDDPKSLVSTDWLDLHLDDPDLRILDGSWHLPGTGRNALDEYKIQHIPGAIFFDIDKICDKDTSLPHMMPKPEEFISSVGELGIGSGNQIVVYDSLGLFSAARVWWMFRYMGHSKTAVLDGGLPAWLAENRKVTEEVVEQTRRHMFPSEQRYMIRYLEEVTRASNDKSELIVDARPESRFHGQAPEPRPNLRSGHIPGSVNIPYTSLLTKEGKFKSKEEITKIFQSAGIDSEQFVITSCGSGVTAAILSLALEIIGHYKKSLYDGSWAEWGGRQDLPIITS